MSAMNTAASTFSCAFNSIKSAVAFDATWANGTGYMDGAVHDQTIAFGDDQIVTCIDNHGRRMIIIQSRFGNIVIFARYKGEDNSIFTWNAPTVVERFLGFGGSLTGEQIRQLTGDPKWSTIDPHFGARLEILFDY